MARKQRKNYSAKEKVAILRRHLLDHVAVSDLCDEYKLQPTVFYRWQKEFFENGEAAFERDLSNDVREAERKLSALELKLRRKDEVLAELMEEHVALKKTLGEI
jgi:transposase-like protein